MSWNQLKAIIDENRKAVNELAGEPVISCPIDGALLQRGRSGVLNCPLGNFTWPEGTQTISEGRAPLVS